MEAAEMPLEELKQATLAKVQEMVTDQSDGSPRYGQDLLCVIDCKSHLKSKISIFYNHNSN